jgi:hemerythrin-like domain-containing protein
MANPDSKESHPCDKFFNLIIAESMKANWNNRNVPERNPDNNRRVFLKNGLLYGTLAGIAGMSSLTGCSEKAEEEISPAEDLMREHGVLNRILLIYDTCKLHLINGEEFPTDVLHNSAMIIHDFIEGYHEKLEEDILFPRFLKQNYLAELIQVLSIQHSRGRDLTGQIIELTGTNILSDPDEIGKLIQFLDGFNAMYRPHEAREDTVLFPAIRKIIPENEYFEMGEDFESKEHELFGEDGFESMVEKVADLETQLGIYELSEFTPQ